MPLKKKLIVDSSGGVIILVAVTFSLLMGILGLTVDAGRMYAVQSKAQNAADAALLGAVSTMSNTNLATETARLFNANYPAGYMGGAINSITTTVLAPGAYSVNISITVPLSIMQIFGSSTTTINVYSRVNAGYQLASPQSLELALVIDNSGASDTVSLAAAGTALSNSIFNGAASLSNVHVSVIPYDVDIDIGDTYGGWIQSAFLADYTQYSTETGGGKGFIENRNSDSPPNGLVDVSDVAPTTDATRFRVPYAYDCNGKNKNNGKCKNNGNGNGNNGNGNGKGKNKGKGLGVDFVSPNLAKMQFALNSNSAIQSALNSMQATGGDRRINVGLMWGWFSLSPNWQGLFNAGVPGLPAADSALNSKQLVLVVTGSNDVYLGDSGDSDDDATTAQLCTAIRAKGIQIYTVGYGAAGSYDQTLLQNCATSPTNFYAAATPADLTTALQNIANSIQYSTIRISQ